MTRPVDADRLRGRRLLLAGFLVVAGFTAATLAFGEGAGSEEAGQVSIFPSDGTPTASPRTEIAFRGVAPGRLGEVTVRGSRSGVHQGRVVGHSDAEGLSLVFSEPFRAGETVTVRTGLDVVGAEGGDVSFRIAARAPARPPGGAGAQAPPGREAVGPPYRSRPDLQAPEISIRRAAPDGRGDGHLFLSSGAGPVIADDSGEPVWLAPPGGGPVGDFRMQRHEGLPVLTWWQDGAAVLVDERYRTIGRVRAANGYAFDRHEALITGRGTFLGIAHVPVAWDLRAVGGPRDGTVVEAVVQEVDIRTGRVLFEWHSLAHVAVEESRARLPADPRVPFDYLRVTSVDEDTDGNLLVTGRATRAVYKIDRRTGAVLWRLGGARDDFGLPAPERMAHPHDVARDPDGTIRVFDGRVLWYRVDEPPRRARVVRRVADPAGRPPATDANAQRLEDGGTVVGWGSEGRFSEIGADDEVLLAGRVAGGARAYRFAWAGRPRSGPALAAERRGARPVVWASWNGATDVASWEVLAGPDPDALVPVGSRGRTGFETELRVDSPGPWFAVRARDADGAELATSRPERVRASG